MSWRTNKPVPARFRRVTTPTVLQMESAECGAAALGIILAYHRRYVALEELRVECRVSRDGSNALYIKKTAEKYGLNVRAYEMPADDLLELQPPFIVFWEFNHFLVVEGFSRGRVYLSDPASGRRSVDEESFRASYTGIAFEFEPRPTFRKGGVKPSTWRAIFGRLRGRQQAMAYVVLAGVTLVACDLVVASFNLIFVDQLLIQERRHWIRPLLLAMGLTAVFRILSGILQQGALRRLKLNLAMSHSARFLWHVLRLPVTFYQQRFAGEISGRVDGNSLVADLIAGPLATTAVGLLMVVFYASMMLAFDPLLTAVGVVIGCLNLVGIAAAGRLMTEENLKIKQVRGRLHGGLMRAIQVIETIKAGSLEPEILVRLSGLQARITNSSQVVGGVGALLIAVPPFLLTLTTAVVLWMGGYRVIEGVMSVGALLAFQTLLANFNRPFADLVRLGSSVQSLQAELERLDDVCRHPCDVVFDPVPAPIEPGSNRREPPRRLSGHLVLDNVTFGYNRALDKPLIERFSLEVTPGSRVALVGSSGSGKSTIGRLVAGLYRPWEGRILYDGFSIDEIPRNIFTSQVAMVDDQTFLFSGTLRDNLTLWDETIPDREMIRAAIDAGIHGDLIKRRGGYQAGLAEGARNLSGGQRQRLEIARALIRNPALIVLDEATSALDPTTEALVDDNLRRRGCTCLIIAHRLSTIRDCDEIIVLDQGQVVQRGTHDQLIADRSGYYHELQSLQGVFDSETKPPTRRREGLKPRGVHTSFTPTTNGRAPFHQEPEERTPVSAARAKEADAHSEGESGEDRPDASHDLAGPGKTKLLLHALESHGEIVTTAGNHPLPLDDAGAVWRVVSGQVDVFYIHPEPGQSRGSRQHLCRVEEGGSIFAVEGVRGTYDGGLLAVGVGPATLLKFPKADLIRLSLQPVWRHGVAEMIDDWIDRVSRASNPGEPPHGLVRVEAGTARTFAAGDSASARGGVLWVRAPEQGLKFLGQVTVASCPFGSRFPLSPEVWLTLGSAGEVSARDTVTLMEDGDPWVGLKRFHRVMLDWIAQARIRERAVRHGRLESSSLRDDSMVTTALARLSRLARPDERVPVMETPDQALLGACRLVGAAIGIEVKEPPFDATGDPLKLIARASGFWTRRVRLEKGWWESDGGPLLGFLAENARPVALIPGSRNTYRLIDSSRGVSMAVTEEVAKTLRPSAEVFYRTLSEGPLGVGGLVRFGLPLIRGELRALVILGAVCGVLGLFAPSLLSIVIDDVIPRAERPRLSMLCGLLISIGAGVAIFQALQGQALIRIKGKLETSLVPALWDRLFNLPARFFLGHESGDLALRALGIVRLIEVLASSSVASLVIGSVSLLNLIVLISINGKLALVAVGLNAIAPIVSFVILPSLWRCQRAITRSQGKMSALLLVLLGGIARLRVAGAEKRAFALWAEMYRHQLGLMIRYQKLSDRLTIFGDIWPLVTIMAVFAAVIGLLDSAAITTGEFLAFNLALTMGMAAVIGLGKNLIPLINGLEQFERFRPILEAVPEVGVARAEAITLQGAIRMTNISFRYDEGSPLVLDSVSLHVRPGEFVAIVGPSGSGKSTLLRLLLGFDSPTEGVVAYDGRELFTFDVREVRRQIGVVLQDAQLFPGDIDSNIVGLSTHLTREDAWEAAELSGLADDIRKMPMGIHTVIGEGGAALSSGQRQRLIIARALAGKPKILLLDEATSALDNRSQAVVSRSLNTRLQGTSRVAIAHRVSTVVDADRIYVLNEGKIVQSGRYSQLIAEPGPFQDFARRQMLS